MAPRPHTIASNLLTITPLVLVQSVQAVQPLRSVQTVIGKTRSRSFSIAEAMILQRYPEIDPDLRIGKIEPGPGAIERLLGYRIAGHKERELLMPLAGPGDLMLGNVLDFGGYSFHANAPFVLTMLSTGMASPSMGIHSLAFNAGRISSR
jgi:hypothetical protein